MYVRHKALIMRLFFNNAFSAPDSIIQNCCIHHIIIYILFLNLNRIRTPKFAFYTVHPIIVCLCTKMDSSGIYALKIQILLCILYLLLFDILALRIIILSKKVNLIVFSSQSILK